MTGGSTPTRLLGATLYCVRGTTRNQPSRQFNRKRCEPLRHAAAVAAYHSKARHASVVRVYCTRARFVRKEPGTTVGTVQVSQGTVMKVRPETTFATRVGIFCGS